MVKATFSVDTAPYTRKSFDRSRSSRKKTNPNGTRGMGFRRFTRVENATRVEEVRAIFSLEAESLL